MHFYNVFPGAFGTPESFSEIQQKMVRFLFESIKIQFSIDFLPGS